MISIRRLISWTELTFDFSMTPWRTREAVSLTYYPSEFSKVRIQVDRDRSEAFGRPFTSVWLQFEVLIGAHGAHKF